LYDRKWISEAVDIKFQGKENQNENLILFHSVTYPNLQQILVKINEIYLRKKRLII